MTRNSAIVVCIGLGTFTFFQLTTPEDSISNDTKDNAGSTAIELTLSEQAVESGTTIRLRALLPNKTLPRITSVAYTVNTIGIFHAKQNRLVFYEEPGRADGTFEGLPRGVTGSHGLDFTVTDGRNSGFEVSFRAVRAGIYRIRTEWHVHGTQRVVPSNWVTLAVEPKRDANGTAILTDKTCSGFDLEEAAQMESLFDHKRQWSKRPLKQLH